MVLLTITIASYDEVFFFLILNLKTLFESVLI
jgi:hypothetical protein